MSDDLAIGDSAGTTVVTTELDQEATALTQLVQEIQSCQCNLAKIDAVVGNGLLTAADAPQSALLAERDIDDAVAILRVANEHCEQLQRAVSRTAHLYELVEREIGQLEQSLAAMIAHFLGAIAPALIALILPGVGSVATGLASLSDKDRARLFGKAKEWLTENARYLTDPRAVTAVRLGVMSMDDLGMGLLHMPSPIASGLGDEGLGILGVNTSAAFLALWGPAVGVFRETPVHVEKRGTAKGLSNANTIEDRLTRIPKGSAQIRIDRHSSPGREDWFEVYIAGTEDFSPVSGSQPFDLTSNISAVAGGSDGSPAASYQAVVEAMKQEGIDTTSKVGFNGYSQGGLIAAQLAASGDYTTVSLVTFGAPAGQVSVPGDIPYLAVEHADDVVPALGGTFESSDPLVVRRRVFDTLPAMSEPPLPAHLRLHYSETAELIDHSTNDRLQSTLDRLSHPQAESVTATFYSAERSTK